MDEVNYDNQLYEPSQPMIIDNRSLMNSINNQIFMNQPQLSQHLPLQQPSQPLSMSYDIFLDNNPDTQYLSFDTEHINNNYRMNSMNDVINREDDRLSLSQSISYDVNNHVDIVNINAMNNLRNQNLD